MVRKKKLSRSVREFLEMGMSAQQRKEKEQKAAAKEERRLRRELAKIGLTPEEFEERAGEFERKFDGA